MSYICRLFYNTGFDNVNIPDSSTLLEQYRYKDVPSLDILQDRELSSIRIDITYELMKGADYCQIGNTYYIINGYTMLNTNTCQLSLVVDYITSNGGIDAMIVESGWVNRTHIPKDADVLFDYVLDEPFTPNDPLELSDVIPIKEVKNDNEWTILQSTIKLEDLGITYKSSDGLDALWFKAWGQGITEANEDTLVIPKLPYAGEDLTTTAITAYNNDIGEILTTGSPGTLYFVVKGVDKNTSYVNDGITVARSAGVESAILNQYVLPESYIDLENTEFLGFDDYDYTRLVKLTSKNEKISVGALPFEYNLNVKNKKVFSGKYNQYVLCSNVSGNKITMVPEDIRGGSVPEVRTCADLRANGKPWAYFNYYKGNYNNLMMMSCEGLSWQNAPLIYYDKSGSTLDRYNFNSQYQQNTMNRTLKQIDYTAKMLTPSQEDLNMNINPPYNYDNFIGPLSKNQESMADAGVRRMVAGHIANIANVGREAATAYANDRMTQNRDIFNFTASQNLIVPDINFPRSEDLRDYLGNNFYLYRYKLSENDLQRYDKFLTMFGYSVSLPFTKDLLTNRPYFNYISVGNAHISYNNDTSMSYRLGAENQLSSGVRIWHVRPDFIYYDRGNEEASND